MYDRTIAMFDEGHPPELLEQLMKSGSLHKGRFLAYYSSYLVQLMKINTLNIKSVLEIGPGENIISDYIKSLGIRYESMDISVENSPTIRHFHAI